MRIKASVIQGISSTKRTSASICNLWKKKWLTKFFRLCRMGFETLRDKESIKKGGMKKVFKKAKSWFTISGRACKISVNLKQNKMKGR